MKNYVRIMNFQTLRDKSFYKPSIFKQLVNISSLFNFEQAISINMNICFRGNIKSRHIDPISKCMDVCSSLSNISEISPKHLNILSTTNIRFLWED